MTPDTLGETVSEGSRLEGWVKKPLPERGRPGGTSTPPCLHWNFDPRETDETLDQEDIFSGEVDLHFLGRDGERTLPFNWNLGRDLLGPRRDPVPSVPTDDKVARLACLEHDQTLRGALGATE